MCIKIPLNKFHYYSDSRTFVTFKSNLEELPEKQFDIMMDEGHITFFIEDELYNLETNQTVFWKYRSENYNTKAYIYNE